jgi:signal-transduction protein with cAMP-binding, CBS, and nucleotidyltransferase domain
LLDAYKKMIGKEIGRILIVDPANPKKLMGIITRTDIMHVFHVANETQIAVLKKRQEITYHTCAK